MGWGWLAVICMASPMRPLTVLLLLLPVLVGTCCATEVPFRPMGLPETVLGSVRLGPRWLTAGVLLLWDSAWRPLITVLVGFGTVLKPC